MLKKFLALAFFMSVGSSLWANPIKIVAAESFYGDIAQMLGGHYVKVVSILKNPEQDPHLFSSTPAIAKAIENADIVIYNGINYDSWMPKLIRNKSHHSQNIIIVAHLIGKQSGDNPHIWYDPQTMLVYAEQLSNLLQQLDPGHRAYYQQQLQQFTEQAQAYLKQISQVRLRYQGQTIIATEPVFYYLAQALNLTLYGNRFQISIMNETVPSAKDTKNFEDKLNNRQVSALIYNNQVTNPLTERLKALAIQKGIPIIGVSETQPLHQDYYRWMTMQLNTLTTALAKDHKP